jgi:glycosyltransferase involved in cell wall biosynthesis
VRYIDDLDPKKGGVAAVVSKGSEVLSKSGMRVTILTHESPEPSAALGSSVDCNDDPKIIGIGSPRLKGLFFGPRQLREIENQLLGADVLQLHCLWSIPGLQIASAARKMGVPYIITLHGVLNDWAMNQGQVKDLKKNLFLMLAGNKMLAGAEAVQASCRSEAEQSRRFLGGREALVLPPIFDLSRYSDLPGPELARRSFTSLNNDNPKILFLARLHPKKGCEHLIEAASILKVRGLEPQFIIAGSGDSDYTNQLKARVGDLGVSEQFLFTGHIDGDLKISLYQNADVFVLPTYQENFGLVFLEALACKVPVITTKGVDIWRELESSGATDIIEREPRAIADMLINRLQETGQSREERGKKGRDWVFDNFGEKGLAATYERLYRSLMF